MLAESELDLRRPFRARLDYHQPLDLGDELVLVETHEDTKLGLMFHVDGVAKAVACVEAV